MLKVKHISWLLLCVVLIFTLLSVSCNKTTTTTTTPAAAAATTTGAVTSTTTSTTPAAATTTPTTTTTGINAPATTPSSDTTSPGVLATNPSGNSADIDINTTVSVVFTEDIMPATINEDTFTLMRGDTPIEGTLTYNETEKTAVFTPAEALTNNTVYKANIDNSVTDLAGNKLASALTWTFTTIKSEDETAPTVSSVSPAHNSANVALNSAISAVFSEEMDASTLNTGAFSLRKSNLAVTGTVSYEPATRTLKFTPSLSLDEKITYTATISGSVTDRSGNPLGSDYSWSFTTLENESSSGGGGGGGGSSTPDTTPPTIASVTPEVNSTDVAVNEAITVTFSENMNSTSLAGNLILLQGSSEVAGTVSLSKKIAKFSPEHSLDYNTVYTVQVLTGATDSAGNALEEEYSWNFKTGISDQSVVISVNTPAEVTAGSEFDVQIDISEVNKLASCELDLVFDNSVIELIDGEFTGRGLVGGKYIEITAMDKTTKIRILGTVQDYETSGTGYLVVIHFKAIGSIGQTSDLEIIQVYASNVYHDYLYSTKAEPIQCEPVGGTVEIVAAETE